MTGVQLQKAMLAIDWSDTLEFIELQYNPAELTFSKSTALAEIAVPGLDSPLLQFVRGQAETLTMDLFFDTTEDGTGAGARSVTEETDLIYQLVKIEPSTHAPPTCTLLWNSHFPGSDVSSHVGGNQRRTDFHCVVDQVRQRFTLFSPEGVPLRATLTVTLREYKTLDQQLRELNLNSPDRTHSHVVQRGDTLSSIAGRHYGTPDEWRVLARANDIEDPRRLTPGVTLAVPPHEAPA
jgi:hypothetical protein